MGPQRSLRYHIGRPPQAEAVAHPAWPRFLAGALTAEQLAATYAAAWRAVTEPVLLQGVSAGMCEEARTQQGGASAPAGAAVAADGDAAAEGDDVAEGGDAAEAKAAAAALLDEYYERIRTAIAAHPGPLDSSTVYLLLRRR